MTDGALRLLDPKLPRRLRREKHHLLLVPIMLAIAGGLPSLPSRPSSPSGDGSQPRPPNKQQPAANPAVQSLDEDAEGDAVGLADESEVSHVARHGNKDHCARCRRQGPSIIF